VNCPIEERRRVAVHRFRLPGVIEAEEGHPDLIGPLLSLPGVCIRLKKTDVALSSWAMP
jgi:hypothetical protein